MNRRNLQLGFYPVGSHSELLTAGSVQTLTRPSGADALIMQNTGTADILFTLDGSNPDADTGFRLFPYVYELRVDLLELNIKVWLLTGASLQYQWIRLLG